LIQDNVDLACVGPENADLQIIADSVRPQNSERIGVFAGEKTAYLIGWQTSNFEGLHIRVVTLMLHRFNSSSSQ